jgi:hypothetical protein
MVPYFKPLASLEMLKRVIKKMDIATGTEVVKRDYLTKGSQRSTHREGNKTVVWPVFPWNLRNSMEGEEFEGEGNEIVRKWRFTKQPPNQDLLQ